MKKINLFKTSMAAVLVLTIASSCSKHADVSTSPSDPATLTNDMMAEGGANPDETSINARGISGTSRDNNHYLYTESNGSGTNTILTYKITGNGSLNLQGTIDAGGNGTGVKLGSQGALVLDNNNEWLYAVNAGSNSVSSYRVHDNGSVSLAHTEYTHGTTPVSVAVHGNLLYVLNRGSDNIHGFHIGAGGTLTSIDGSGKALSSTAVDAPQISFLPNGNWIVVTEKATNKVSTFKVNNDGSVNNGIFTNATGQTPFGFGFSRDFMIVSNASGGAAGAGTTTSYITGNNGVPHDVNGAKANYQAAPCWVAITKFGRFAYTTNTASNNISAYYVAPWGGLYLVDGTAATTDMGPLDIVVSGNNYYVYALNSASHTITGYNREFFGGINFIGRESGIPDAATGLATF